MRVSDISKPSQDGLPSQNGPSVPDRSVKPHFGSGVTPSDDQDRCPEEEGRDGDHQEKLSGEKERQERGERERHRKEEEERKYQERKKLERQKAEEEEESKEGRGGEKRGKESNSDTPTKSASLDSPAPNRIITEIKVSVSASRHSTPLYSSLVLGSKH